MSNTDKSDTDHERSATDVDSEAESNRQKKAPPLSGTEKQILLELINRRKPIIEEKSTNYGANYRKKMEWDKIAVEFCSQMGTVRRTAAQLKTWWENSKKRAKRSMSEKKRGTKVTSGWKAMKPNSKSDAIEEVVVDIDPSQMRSLANPYRSNNCGNTELYTTGEDVVTDKVPDKDHLNEEVSIVDTSDFESHVETYETSTSHWKKRRYDPHSVLGDMELEEHKMRMKILAVKLETEMIRKAAAEEMKFYAYEEHKKKMLLPM